ncbi:MAG: hypothetical protein IT349_12625 [Candidatus Eisenbacteria bacterium]|nr:hypothetical protein [Candidatus Eisenbacteria bacterium]
MRAGWIDRCCGGIPDRALGARWLLLLIVAGAGLARPDSVQAGAWTREKGTFYNRTAINRYVAEEEFDGQHERQDLPLEARFTDLNLSNYFEYGLTDRFTAIGSFSIKSLESENLVRVIETKGIGDIDLALRARLSNGQIGVTAVQFLAKVPSAYDADADLPLGNGELEFDTHLLYGRSLWPLLPGYCGLEAGYRVRGGAPADEFRYLAEFGSDLGAGFFLRSKLDGTRGRRNQKSVDSYNNPTLRGSSDVGALDLTMGRKFGDHLSLEAGYSAALYGRTTTAGSTLTGGLSYSGRLRRAS